MAESDNLDLYESLLNAQVELKAPKGQFNNFGKYKYRSAEDILEAVKPVNRKHGLTLTLSDEIEQFGERYYIKATATITNGSQVHSVSAYAREALTKKGMDDSQITGTASSYARKYALNGLYLIDDTKDADTDEYTKNTRQTDGKPITQKQVGDLKLKAKQFAQMRGQDETAVYTALGVSDITSLTENVAKNAITRIDEWIKKANEKQ